MSMEEKARILYEVVVGECYCDWGIFQENVRTSSDKGKSFRESFRKCNSKEDIVSLVNQYIYEKRYGSKNQHSKRVKGTFEETARLCRCGICRN